MVPQPRLTGNRYPQALPLLKTLLVRTGCAMIRSRTWRQAWTRIIQAIGLTHV